MLSREEIAGLAKRRGLAPWQEEKRYVQALVLYSLRGAPLVLKGGTYLWLFHALDRFSDDLDFAEVGKPEEELQSAVVSTTRLFGLFCSTKPVKDDRHTLSFRIDARGPLYTGERDLCRVYVEVSRREEVKEAPLQAKLDEPLYGLPLVFLRGMDLGEIAAEKVRAIVRRGKARDLYDLWYLLRRRSVAVSRALVDDKMSFYGRMFEAAEFARSVESIGRSWSKELGPIVIGEIPPFDEVKESVERLVR